MYYLFYRITTNFGYPSKLCMAFGHHNPSSGKPLGCFLVFICRNIKDYAYMNSKSGASSHNVKAPQNMLDGMIDKGVFAILLQEASKRLQLNNCF